MLFVRKKFQNDNYHRKCPIVTNVKWPFRVIQIQGHVFWGQWKAGEGLHIAI